MIGHARKMTTNYYCTYREYELFRCLLLSFLQSSWRPPDTVLVRSKSCLRKVAEDVGQEKKGRKIKQFHLCLNSKVSREYPRVLSGTVGTDVIAVNNDSDISDCNHKI